MLDEYALQRWIVLALMHEGIAHEKEQGLGRGTRVDFLTAGAVAVDAF